METHMSTPLAATTGQANGSRTIYNPVQKDSVRFLKTSAETGGEYSRLEMVVAPGGGNIPHYHTTYAEHFNVVEGTLEVMVGGETHTLHHGETTVAPMNTLHKFHNPSAGPTSCVIEMRPGSEGFEKALRVLYGLAGDGLVRANGIPKNLYYTALIGEWSDMRLPGRYKLAEPLFRVLARRARRIGVDRDLEARYCP